MYLVNVETKSIQECTVLSKKTGYTTLQIGNEIFGLPSEDSNYYLCDKYETACLIVAGGIFVPQ